MAIFLAFIVIAVLGLLLGLGLSFADSKLKVEKAEKLEQMEAIMPGANCGGCGFAGCSAYAEAVYKGEAEIGLCAPGGNALSEKMGEIMGVKVEEKEKMVAFVFCQGNPEVTGIDYDYRGMKDCNAASLLLSGPNSCKAGCLHLGSCIAVCPAGAISKNEKGNIVVDREKCIGCGKCTRICPNGVTKMIPYSAKYVVACNNHEPGALVRKECKVGCIGCRLCQNKVESSPFVVEDNLSSVDYSKDMANGDKAVEICPQKCILKR